MTAQFGKRLSIGLLTGATLALVALLARPAAAARPDRCDPVRCSVQATIEQQCPCAATGHGSYYSCVSQLVNNLAQQGTIPNACKRRLKYCAAGSTCGRPGFVACQIPVTSPCNVATGKCRKLPRVACSSSADCVVATQCKVMASAGACAAAGGTPGSGTTCCPNCAP